MPKGTIVDFLQLVANTPELARDLGELASRHDFTFTSDELSDDQLDGVAGGTLVAGSNLASPSVDPDATGSGSEEGDDAQLANVDMQNALQRQQQTLQMMTNISKMLSDTSMSIIRKMGS